MAKSATLAWELMFTRSTFATEDMAEQHRILDRVADLVDAGQMIGRAGDRVRVTQTTPPHGAAKACGGVIV